MKIEKYHRNRFDENYDARIKAGCWGCFGYVLLFFGAGGVILAFDLPIILSVPVLAVFALIWFIFFVRATRKDKKEPKSWL